MKSGVICKLNKPPSSLTNRHRRDDAPWKIGRINTVLRPRIMRHNGDTIRLAERSAYWR